MDYKKIYDQLIEKRRGEEPAGYSEQHHIIPRSLGGGDSADNIVKLTAREHFLCHYLLTRIYARNSLEWHKMNLAFLYMKASSLSHNRYFNSRLYDALKQNFSMTMKVMQRGENNSQYGTRWIHSKVLEQSKKVSKNDPLPKDWFEGRVVNFSKSSPQCKVCGKDYLPLKAEQYCSKECKAKRFREISPTTYWQPILASLEKEFPTIKGTVSENRIFILEAMSKKVPKNQILWHLKCNNSGANYRTMKQIIAPTSGL